jgi:hypothetical protein
VPSGRIEKILLPIHGHVSEAFSRPNEPGIAITLSSWLAPSAVYFYDPVRRIFEPRKLAKVTNPRGFCFVARRTQRVAAGPTAVIGLYGECHPNIDVDHVGEACPPRTRFRRGENAEWLQADWKSWKLR